MKRLIALIIVLLLGFYVGWPGWTAYRIAGAVQSKDANLLESKIDFSSVRESLKPAAVHKIGEVYDRYQTQAGPGSAAVVGQIKNDVVPKFAALALQQLVTAPVLIRIANEGGALKDNIDKLVAEQIGKNGLPGIPGLGGLKLPGGIGGGAGAAGSGLPGGLGNVLGGLGGKIPGLGGKIPGLGGSAAAGKDSTAATATPAAAQPDAKSGGKAPSYGLANIKRFGLLGPLGFEIGFAKDAAASEADATIEMRFTGGDWRVTGVRPKL